jgi:hypothetical protein
MLFLVLEVMWIKLLWISFYVLLFGGYILLFPLGTPRVALLSHRENACCIYTFRFQSGCNHWPSHLQCMKILVAPCLLEHLVLSFCELQVDSTGSCYMPAYLSSFSLNHTLSPPKYTMQELGWTTVSLGCVHMRINRPKYQEFSYPMHTGMVVTPNVL